MKTSEFFSEVASAAPSLRSWSDEWGSDADTVGESVIHLRSELIERSQDGRIKELPELAPLIERLLGENDNEDEISLGFIEPLVWRALDGTLDATETRRALGPAARSVWDVFYIRKR